MIGDLLSIQGIWPTFAVGVAAPVTPNEPTVLDEGSYHRLPVLTEGSVGASLGTGSYHRSPVLTAGSVGAELEAGSYQREGVLV